MMHPNKKINIKISGIIFFIVSPPYQKYNSIIRKKIGIKYGNCGE